MTWTTGRRVVGLAICAVILTACSASGGQGAEAGDEPVTIRWGDGPFLSQAGVFVAQDRGYFEEEGLEVVSESYMDASVVVSGLIGGDLDLGAVSFSAGFFNSLASGAPITVFASRSVEEPGHATLGTVVSNELWEDGVRSGEDLARLSGLAAAIPATGSINHYALARPLQAAGVDPAQDITWVTGLGQPEIVSLLGAGEIQFANLASNFAKAVEDQGFGRIIMWGDEFEPGLQVTGLAVRNDFLAENRDAVVRFATAYLRGAQEAATAIRDPDSDPGFVDILVDNTTFESTEDVEALWPNWSFVPPEGRVDGTSVARQQDYWADEYGLVESKISIEDVLDDSIRQDALEVLAERAP